MGVVALIATMFVLIIETIVIWSGWVWMVFVLWNVQHYASIPLSSAGACFWAFWVALVVTRALSGKRFKEWE